MFHPSHNAPCASLAPRNGVWGAVRALRRESRKGMTLIEIMVVIALMAAMLTITAYGLGFIGRSSVQGESLRFSGLVRYVYNAAATQKRTLQLVINLEDGSFYVDELDINGGLTKDALAGKTLQMAISDDDDDDDDDDFGPVDKEDAAFATITRDTISGPVLAPEDTQLAEGVHFLGVMTSHHEEMQTEGIATINFFPSGFVERTIIYLGDTNAKESDDEGIVFSLVINPLTGHTSIFPGRRDVDDTFFELEEDD